MNFDIADNHPPWLCVHHLGIHDKEMGIQRAVHQLCTDFKKVHDSIPRDILYNIFNECDILINLVRLNRTCLNVTYNKVQSWKYLSVTFTVQNGLKEGHVL
jgi:hypothetical protein